MAEHSDLVGGSSAGRVIQCPGSVNLAKTLPRPPTSEYAHKGTLCHNAMEKIVPAFFTCEVGTYLPDLVAGMTLRTKKDTYTLDDEMIEDKIIPAITELQKLYDNDVIGETCRVEQKVSFKHEVLDGAFGTADIIDTSENDDGLVVCTILDWKFGAGVLVSPENNSQGLFYAAAAMETHPYGMDADLFEIIIVQPSNRTDDNQASWTATREQVQSFKNLLVDSVAAIDNKPGIFNTGKDCRWCPAKAACPKQKEIADTARSLTIDELQSKDLGVWLERADTLENWIHDLRAYAYKLLENGQKVPGYKLVQKQGRNKWVDEKYAETVLPKLFDEKEIFTRKLITAPQALKLAKKKKIDTSELEKNIAKVSSGLTIAVETDKRPAATSHTALTRLGEHLNTL